ncbi:MAG: ABC transporter substrate-binding protein [Thermodesulfobacteriota bacterium]
MKDEKKQVKEKEMENSQGVSRRQFLIRTGVVAAGLSAFQLSEFLNAPHVKAAGGPPILIGNIEPLSGPYADSGQDEMEGAMLANEEWNAKGGVLGREIKMITEDAPSNPGIGVQKVIKLLKKDNVNFLTGTLTSSVTLAIAEEAVKEHKLFMAFGSHSDDTTMQKSHRTTFRTTSQNWMLSTAVGSWLGKNWKPKTIYHITADYTWGHTARTSMNRALSKYGCKEIGNDFTPLGTKDFSANLIKARGLKPDLLSCNCYGSDQVNLVKQFKEFGLAKEIHLCGPLSGAPMMKGIGPAADGVWGLSWDCTVDTPGSQKLRAALKKRFAASKVPQWDASYRHYLGYITHNQLFEAIARAKTTDMIPVIKALEGWKFDGLKWTPSYWRKFDHQNIQDVIVAKAQYPANFKTWADLFKILGHMPGDEVAPTYEEWKKEGGHELEPYDMFK